MSNRCEEYCIFGRHNGKWAVVQMSKEINIDFVYGVVLRPLSPLHVSKPFFDKIYVGKKGPSKTKEFVGQGGFVVHPDNSASYYNQRDIPLDTPSECYYYEVGRIIQ